MEASIVYTVSIPSSVKTTIRIQEDRRSVSSYLRYYIKAKEWGMKWSKLTYVQLFVLNIGEKASRILSEE